MYAVIFRVVESERKNETKIKSIRHTLNETLPGVFSPKTPRKSAPASQVTSILPRWRLNKTPSLKEMFGFPQWKHEVRACGLDYRKSKPLHAVSENEERSGWFQLLAWNALPQSARRRFARVSDRCELSRSHFGQCRETFQGNIIKIVNQGLIKVFSTSLFPLSLFH